MALPILPWGSSANLSEVALPGRSTPIVPCAEIDDKEIALEVGGRPFDAEGVFAGRRHLTVRKQPILRPSGNRCDCEKAQAKIARLPSFAFNRATELLVRDWYSKKTEDHSGKRKHINHCIETAFW